jgi:hypothetical protein
LASHRTLIVPLLIDRISFTWMENALAPLALMKDVFDKWISNPKTDSIAGQFFCGVFTSFTFANVIL